MSSSELPTSERIDRLERLVEQNAQTMRALLNTVDKLIVTQNTTQAELQSFRSEVREQHTIFAELQSETTKRLDRIDTRLLAIEHKLEQRIPEQGKE